MLSAYQCRCGCGENVGTQGQFVKDHDRLEVSEAFKQYKTQKLKESEDAKKAKRSFAPNFGRGVGQTVQPGTHVPAKAPVIGGRKG